MATPTTLCSLPPTIPMGQATGFAPFQGLQSCGVTSCCRLGPSFPNPVPAHAVRAARLCKHVNSVRIHVSQSFLSVEASSSSSACGIQRSCCLCCFCTWKRRRLIEAGCKFKPCAAAAAAAESSDILVSEPESSDSGYGILGETREGGQRRLQELRERGRERTMSLEDIASLFVYPLDEFQV